MAGPLEGISVLDTSERSPAAAIAGMLLSDLGATVVRVEPAGGDGLRALDAHHVWMRGQQSVEVNEATSAGDWAALRDRADVVLHTVQPRQNKPYLLKDWTPGPGQVLAVLTAVPRRVEEALGGSVTDQAVYGELIEAQYGLLHDQQGHRDGPIFLGWPLATYGAAWLLTLGVLAALADGDTQKRGQTLTTSLLDGVAYLSVGTWSGGPGVPPMPSRSSGAPQQSPLRFNRSVISLLECGDGEWVFVHTMARGAFDRLMKIIGRADLVDPSNADLFSPLEPSVADKMWEDVYRTFTSEPAQHWFEVLSASDIPCMVANPAGRALLIEQYAINGLRAEGSDGHKELGAVAKYARTPMRPTLGSPDPGSSGLADLDKEFARLRADRIASGLVREAGSDDVVRGPLEGLLVLDFGFFMAGPFSPRLMADLGARVIKIEETSGDPMRGPNGGFLGCARGKESLAVDLKTSEGHDLVYELVKRADIVHSNMRKGALERLGIDYESLRAINPQLIYCHSSGYGNDGPWSHLPTFEPLHSASSGVLHRTGGEGNPPLMYLSNMDLGCGFTSTICVLAALIERQHSGEGQYLEVPQTGAGLLAMSDAYLVDGVLHQTYPLDSAQRGHALTTSLYPTADGWVLLSAYDDVEWDGVRRALGIVEEAWPTFERARATLPGDGPDAALLDNAFASMSSLGAQQILEANHVPCTVPTPLDTRRLAIDPLLRELGVIVVEEQADYGPIWETGHGIRFSESGAQHRRPAPAIGQHTTKILTELGLSDEAISVLAGKGVVACRDGGPTSD